MRLDRPRPRPLTPTNSVVAWDLNAQAAIWDVARQQPNEQVRSFAIVNGAVYDAVNAIAGTPYEPYLVAPEADGNESMDAAASQRLNVVQTARLFAMTDLVVADSGVACFRQKDVWSFWRPITAIQLTDPTWTSLLVTPPFPEYPSGHACGTGARMSVYRFFFGRDDIAFSGSSVDSGTTRHFTSFSQALSELIDARVRGGVHFPTADVEGAKLGEAVSRFATRHHFRPLCG